MKPAAAAVASLTDPAKLATLGGWTENPAFTSPCKNGQLLVGG